MASKCGLLIERDNFNRSGRVKRPMNAFLIFCKRQRGSVRRKFPRLENREVTRVLGEWWAALGTADKSLYSALAHQHKENLIRSHPELKWYKQKMPNGTKNKKIPDISQPGIVPGKLADESQLGGLSSLLHLDKEVVREEEKPPLPKPLKKRYRDEIYNAEETKPIVKSIVEEKMVEKTEIVRPTNEINEEEEERLKMWRTHILEENNNVKQSRARACKGQRYREFMWTTYSNRRKANRWELNQDKHEIPVKKPKTAKSEKMNKLSKISNSGEKDDNTLSLDTNDIAIDKKKKKKVVKANGNIDTNVSYNNNSATLISSNVTSTNTPKSVTDDSSCDILQLRIESDSDDAMNSSPNGTSSFKDDTRNKSEVTVIGSRKRKVRRQEIRRLEPGSTFKGFGVISANDLSQE